ncbi:MAG: glycosyl hydrolase 53 family protein [Bacteroidaceae bacterium]|nr:glycosyl hydrolase 53 family protein [Bacteroidaceae bacterium]
MKHILTYILCAMSLGMTAQNKISLGADISMLPEYERVNTPYYDNSGTKIDAFTYMKDEAKMNSMRVRLFVTPTERGTTRTGVCQDLEYVKTLGKRIKDAGMDFLLDFHYSDSWADPSYQDYPKSWSSINQPTTDIIYNYTKECLEALVSGGATPDFVQIGNEISYGMLWQSDNDKCYTNQSAESTQWKRFYSLLSSAAKAVREVTPNAKIIVHTERSGEANTTKEIYSRLNAHDVDYDIIGLSYYPFYHNTLSHLGSTLSTLATAFPDKEVHIVETAYFYQYFASDAKYDTQTTWAATPTGQSAFISDLVTELGKHSNVTGLYYWFPEENGNGGATWSASNVVITSWLNRGLWDNSSHKAQPALLKLQDFLSTKEAASIDGIKKDEHPRCIYSITGQQLEEEPSKGLFIKDGKKMIR